MSPSRAVQGRSPSAAPAEAGHNPVPLSVPRAGLPVPSIPGPVPAAPPLPPHTRRHDGGGAKLRPPSCGMAAPPLPARLQDGRPAFTARFRPR